MKITCPVCDRQEVEEDICPNCETNLSLIRMLAVLPEMSPSVSPVASKYWLPGIVMLLVITGMALGAIFNYWVFGQKPSVVSSSIPTAANLPSLVKQTGTSPQEACRNGFYYTVREGDSLSMIAGRFYGNINDFSLISNANSSLVGRENFLEIGERLLIPNKDNICQ